jgi:RHS repeat-associated protein
MAVRLNLFGDEITSTSNDRTKFGTYTRDSYTGLDYADQRYYASTYGRFSTPDPAGHMNLIDSQTFNQYAYVGGDPINRGDPHGTDWCDWEVDDTTSGFCNSFPDEYAAEQAQSVDSFASITGVIFPNPNPSYTLIADVLGGLVAGYTDYWGRAVVAQQNNLTPLCPLVSPVGKVNTNSNNSIPVNVLFAPQMAGDLSEAISVLSGEGITLTITTGFRTVSENASVGGAPNSNHLVGEAVDVNTITPDFSKIQAAMKAAGLYEGTGKEAHHFQLTPWGTSPSPSQIAACSLEHPDL